ncbi:MAG TPA: PQQ-dependent sugar dehydrogenase [Sporichthya sp.]|nr:PQQ-dependent sugar dehydrogenase [Sporichthya sp.]
MGVRMRGSAVGAGMVAGALLLGLAACSDDPGTATINGPDASGTARPTAARTGASSAPPGAAATTATVAGTVASGLTSPWGLAFLPEGSALVSERDTAAVKRIAPDGTVSTVGTVPGVEHGGEGGLLGIAVGPDVATDPQLYAYRTTDDGNEIVRMTYAPGGLGEPTVLVDGIEAGAIHNGGRLAFGPDGLLYASTGEVGRRTPAQDPGSLNGKILRMTPDGAPAPGNPDPRTLVYSTGHRNVQGLAWDDAGQLWASEFGQNTWDELNLIHAGDNDGWPEVEGIAAGGGPYVNPERQWHTEDASPSGIAVAGGSVWMAALRGERLWQIPLTGDPDRPTGEPRAWFSGDYGRLRTVMTAPDGSLWLITNNTDGRGDPRSGDDRILRVTLS